MSYVNDSFLDLLPIDDQRLRGLLESSLEKKGIPVTQSSCTLDYWNWESFCFARASLPRPIAKLPDPRAVLRELNEFRITDICLAESMGIHYTAKLLLSADSYDLCRLYATFLDDELRHTQLLRPFAPESLRGDYLFHPLVQLGWRVTKSAQPLAARLLLQIVLEGFAVSYYTRLADDCLNSILALGLRSIVRDEAAHHGVGATLERNRERNDKTSTNDLEECVNTTIEFLDLYRNWPHAQLRAVEKVGGKQSESDLAEVLSALMVTARSQALQEQLKKLVVAHYPRDVMSELEQRNAFAPSTPESVLKSYLVSTIRPT